MASTSKKGWSNINQTSSRSLDRLGNEAGALIFSQDSRVDEYGSDIPLDKSSIALVDKFKSKFLLVGGDQYVISECDYVQRVNKNMHVVVQGAAQYNYIGGLHMRVEGDYSFKHGRQSTEDIEASKELNDIADEISNTAVDTITENAGKGDRIACPVCSLEVAVDRGARIAKTITKYTRKIFRVLPNSPLNDTIEKISKTLGKVLAFFLDFLPVSSMNGGSCKTSGCKNNTIASPLYAIQKGNEAAAEKFKKYKNKIEDLEKKLDKSCSVQTYPNNLTFKVGLHFRKAKTVAYSDPIPKPTELEDGSPKYGFVPCSRGTCKTAIYQDCVKTTGTFCIEANEFKTTIGANGCNIDSLGKIKIIAPWIDLTATDGQLNLTTPNQMTLAAANIDLVTKGNANGDAIRLESDRVYVAGKLSVQGDLAIKGSLMMDGGISTTHLTMPCERVETDISSSAHNVHSAPNWNNPIKPDATSMDVFDKIYKVLRDIVAFLIGLVLTPDFLKTKIEEQYSTVRINMGVDNYFLETGYAWVIQYPARLPVQVVGGCTMGGVVTGTVIPAMIPVYNYTHNHGSPGDPHYHSYTVPVTEPWGSNAAAIAARQPASHIPTPAKQNGMGTRPGHKSNGDLGPCGGGGSPFGNASRVSSAILRRNQTYGINSSDAYAGKDYVDANITFNPDGTINPSPSLHIAKCD